MRFIPIMRQSARSYTCISVTLLRLGVAGHHRAPRAISPQRCRSDSSCFGLWRHLVNFRMVSSCQQPAASVHCSGHRLTQHCHANAGNSVRIYRPLSNFLINQIPLHWSDIVDYGLVGLDSAALASAKPRAGSALFGCCQDYTYERRQSVQLAESQSSQQFRLVWTHLEDMVWGVTASRRLDNNFFRFHSYSNDVIHAEKVLLY